MDVKFDFREQFEEAQKIIKDCVNLDLSLIEKVHLKNYVSETIKEAEGMYKENLREDAYFKPSQEAASRFLTDNYGLPSLHPSIWHGFYNAGEGEFHQAICDFVKILQDKSHKL